MLKSRISLIDTEENKNIVINSIIKDLNESNVEFVEKIKEILSKKSLYDLLQYEDNHDVWSDVRDGLYLIIIGIFSKNDKFAEVFKTNFNVEIFTYDFLRNFTIFELTDIANGVVNDFTKKFVNDFKNKVNYYCHEEIFNDEEKTFTLNAWFMVRTKHHYSISALIRRFRNRIGYRWNNARLTAIHVTEDGVTPYSVHVTIEIKGRDEYDATIAENELRFRFGSTSGRPWDACHLSACRVD